MAERSDISATRPPAISSGCLWPRAPPPPMPESAFLRADDLAVFDHVTRRLKLLTIHRPDREDYEAAVSRIDEMERRLASDQVCVVRARSRRDALGVQRHQGPVRGDGRRGSGAHPRRRRVPDRGVAALSQAARGQSLRRLSLPARDQPVAVHVLPVAGRRSPRGGDVAREAHPGRGQAGRDAPAGRHPPSRRRPRRGREGSRRSCSAT